MFSNYIKVGLRNILRHRLFSFINIFGLGLSLSFCLLVVVILVDQYGYDQFEPRGNDLYRVLTIAHRKSGGTEPYASTPYPLGRTLKEQSPGVEQVVTLTGGLRGEVANGLAAVRIRGYFTAPGFLPLFGLDLASGDPSTALSYPDGIVLTDKTAKKLFGQEDPVGKRISIKGLQDFTVTGVLKPLPGKSHLTFDALGSATAVPLLEKEGRIRSRTADWKNYYSSYTYVRLKHSHEGGELTPVLAAISDQFYKNLTLETRDAGYAFELQPLRSISPGRILSNETSRSLPEPVLYFIAVLAVAGMLAALFNYTNLTLARSLTRAKEVGIRKVVGANRANVMAQLMTESIVTALVSLIGGVLLLHLVLIPGFRNLSFMSSTDIDLRVSAATYLWFVGLTVGVGLVAGLLPAAVISNFRPAFILKGLSKVKVFRIVTPRMALVVFQFVLSLVLIIVLTTSVRQLDYAMTNPDGFQTGNIVSIDLQGHTPEVLARELQQRPEVALVSAVSHHMGTWEDMTEDVRLKEDDVRRRVRDYSVDENFLDQFGLTLVAGSNFDHAMGDLEKKMVLVNEEFVKQFQLGSPAQAVGTSMILEDSTRIRIAGVVRNFLFKPLTYELAPMLLKYDPSSWRFLDVGLRGPNSEAAIDHMTRAWKSIDPVHPLQYRSYAHILSDVYSNVWDLLTIVGFLAALAFVVSMLGLLGIVTYNAETRLKEIGIRKVMGAGVKHLTLLLARSEMFMLGIATLIAVPASLWISNQLLQTFAYRIAPGLEVVLPGLLAVYGVSALAVLWQTVKSARTNPVEILRYE